MEKWFGLIGVLLVICIAEWIREIHTFRTTHYRIISPKLNGLDQNCKVVFLSDLHNKTYGKDNQRLLQKIVDIKPDFILIGGDMIVGKPEVDQTVAERFVQQLTAICPVYYANGNHEFRMKEYPEVYGDFYVTYKEKLKSCGVIFLENDHVEIGWNQKVIQIYGLEIPKEGYKKFKKAKISMEDIVRRIGMSDQKKFQILLAHNPIYADLYCAWGADIVLSGHIHGGVVRLPFIGGVISPQFRLFPRNSGEHKKVNHTSVVVSKGLGTHTINIRFMNPAEIVVLHIGGEDD